MMIDAALTIIGVALAIVLLPGTVELAVLTIAGIWAGRRDQPPPARSGYRLAVVVPAHDEAPWIGRTVRSLRASASLASARCDVIVVADNCSDATAAVAESTGARVIVRDDPARRGKGFALQHALTVLREEGFDAYAVVDADTVVDDNFISAITNRLAAGAAAVQCRYLVLNRRDSLRTGLLSAAFLAFNGLRPRGRARLGLSAGLFGNGFALAASTVAAVPYGAGSIVEDLEYHLDLVRAGFRVDFAGETAVRAEMPSGRAGAKTQRARWEGGRLRMFREHVRRLFGEAFRGRWRVIEPLLDLLLPPIGYLVLFAGAAILLPLAPLRALGIFAVAVVALHAVAGLIMGRAQRFEWFSMMLAPAYVVSKLPGIRDVLRTSRRSAHWVRTDRVGTSRQTVAPPPEERSLGKALSAIVVSFNTRDGLRLCLQALESECAGLSHEIIVVDNASRDGSADMVEREFPAVRLMRSERNLGFAAANNLALGCAAGRLALLVNPDAVVNPGAIAPMVSLMEGDPNIGICGGQLVDTNGDRQPSACSFPGLIGDLLILTGLQARFSKSRFFGSPARSWADPQAPAAVDWVVGAFVMIRMSTLDTVGMFDERYFMYYEEVDLCRRIRAAGKSVFYWPEAVAVHAGSASVRTVEGAFISTAGQLVSWQKRSRLLYYRKHHGQLVCWLADRIERAWYAARAVRNGLFSRGPVPREKANESLALLRSCRDAWADTRGGTVSPQTPW